MSLTNYNRSFATNIKNLYEYLENYSPNLPQTTRTISWQRLNKDLQDKFGNIIIEDRIKFITSSTMFPHFAAYAQCRISHNNTICMVGVQIMQDDYKIFSTPDTMREVKYLRECLKTFIKHRHFMTI